MKRKATVCFALVVLLLVSVFSKSIFYGAADSSDASEFTGAQSIEDWWSMFHHDLTHTGNSQSTAPKTNQTLWRFNTGGPVDSPVVSDGVVYVGSLDNNVYALNASNGAVVWKYTTGANVLSPAAVANGVVYVGSEDYNVYALNATTGAYIWSYKTGYFVDSAIAFSNGVVYVASEDNNVYALNASNGARVWSYATGGQIMLSSPAVADGAVYIGSEDHKVYALNATTGAFLWSYTTGDWVVSSPAVANGIVYVGSYDHVVYAFGSSPSTQTHSVGPSPIVVVLLIIAILLIAVLLAVALYRRKYSVQLLCNAYFLPFSSVNKQTWRAWVFPNSIFNCN